jgi:hypothetical protein
MNHTGVDTFRLSQVVKDEANKFLDAAEIGTDEEFVVCATEILSRHEFESRGYCRVPCTIGKAYIKQYLPRNHHKIYRLAYKTTLDANGNEWPSFFYRVIKLKSQLPYTHPSGNELYTFTVDSGMNSVAVNNSDSTYTLPMPNTLDTPIDAYGYYGNTFRRDYDYVYGESPYVRVTTTDVAYNARASEGVRSL